MKEISIIGGGASGTLLVINLIKQYQTGKLTINLIEKDLSRFNRGIAYSTKDLSHLLNVRVEGMSIFPDEPEHFYNWLLSKDYKLESLDKSSFVSRKIYGDYLTDNFIKYVNNKNSNIIINIIQDEVTDVVPSLDKYEIQFLDSKNIKSDIVILAFGNITESEINILKYKNVKNYYRSPWTTDFFDEIKSTDDILILGSGLTAIDVITTLHNKKHSGIIYSISRRGFRPISHELFSKYPDFSNEFLGKDLNGIFSIVKKHIKLSKENGYNIRSVIDSMRPYTPKLWKSFSESDKSRFLRHLNNMWNSIRHRLPNKTDDIINNLVSNGQLVFLTGNITEVNEGDILNVKINDKKFKIDNASINVNSIINCIGPESNYNKINMPLIKNMLKSSLIENTFNNISITTEDHLILNKGDYSSGNLFGIGPVLKGEFFESTAIPEIRVQAKNLASRILKTIHDEQQAGFTREEAC